MSKERIEEVALILQGITIDFGTCVPWEKFADELKVWPEFQEPRSPSFTRIEIEAALRKLNFYSGNRPGNDLHRWSVSDLATDIAPLLIPDKEKSPWIQCSERMPPFNVVSAERFVVWIDKSGARRIDGILSEIQKNGVAWVQINVPPYTAPESELVQRFREKYRENHGISEAFVMDILAQTEKEIANAKA